MLLQALKKKLEGDLAVARANILIYKDKSVGIGEHPDIVEAVEAQVDKYVHALEMVEGVDKIMAQE